MKKIFFIFSIISLILLMSSFITTNNLAYKVGDGLTCKWKKMDCPGWFTGDYEACLSGGDGNECTCGSVTRSCDSSKEVSISQ